MTGALLLFAQAVAVVPAATLVVHTTARTTTLAVVVADGVRAVAGDKFARALGGTLKQAADGHYTLVVGESRVEFTPGMPFARADANVIPMVAPPTVIEKVLYLPFQVVSEIVPHYVTGFMYDTASGEVRAFNTSARRVASVSSGEESSPPNPGSAKPSPSDASDDGDDGAPVIRTKSRSRRLVVVDAGHGGVDHGMTGPIGGGPRVMEKHITLKVAKLVAQNLRDAGIEVLMTRTTDTLIGLYDRGKIANRNHGDVFVSIHVNATGRRGRDAGRERGFETYFLAEAKTEDAKRVERMENEAVRFETGVNATKGDPLSFILNDMAQNEHLRESSELAQIIEDGLHKFHPGPDRGVQQANFAVLRGSFMPAILCEIGFGTNADEAAYISDATHQRTIAKSITKSIITYLDRYEARVGARTSRP